MKPDLALLIDGDQGKSQHVAGRLAELEKTWQVSARVCIRNWRSTLDQANWDAVARDCKLECIQHAPETRYKNATDIELTVRAMDLLHGSGYRAFCILSGDSDFRPLARRLERGGARVILDTLDGGSPAKAAVAAKPKAAPPAKPAAPKPTPAPPKPAPAKAPTAAGKAAPQPVKVAPVQKREPDAAGFGRVVGKAHDECVQHAQGKDGAVPLTLLANRIPAQSRKEAFGYAKNRPMRAIVASLPGFAVVETSPGQHAVRRS